MATPLIKIDQAGQPPGVSGQSRTDIVVDVEVQITDTNNSGESWEWFYEVPSDSQAVPTGLTTNDVRIVPDVPGTYLFYTTISGGGGKSYEEHIFGNDTLRISSQGGFSVLDPNNDRRPGDGETNQFGGWAGAMTDIIKRRNLIEVEGTSVSGGPFTTFDFRAAGGSSVDATTSGDGKVEITFTAGGGGTVSGTGPDYLAAALSTDQTSNVSVGDHIEFDAIASKGTSITASSGTGQDFGIFTLSAGKTYEIHLHIDALTNESSAYAQLWNHTDDIALVDDTGATTHYIRLNDSGGGSDDALSDSAFALITPEDDIEIKVERVSGFNSAFVNWRVGTRLFIMEVPDTSVGGGSGGGSIAVEDEGSQVVAVAGTLNFTGAGVTASDAGGGEVNVNIPGGGGGGDVAVEDDGSQILSAASTLNFTGAGVSISDGGSNEAVIDIPGATGGGSIAGALTLIDSIETTSTVDHVDFGASGDGLYQTELDGDEDAIYVLYFNILHAEAGTLRDFRIWPNGSPASSAQSASHAVSGNTSNWGINSRGDLVFVGGTVRENISGFLTFHAARSIEGNTRYRAFETSRISTSDHTTPSASETNSFLSNGIWGDNTSNITSLRIQSTQESNQTTTSSIAAGSRFLLYKLNREPASTGLTIQDEGTTVSGGVNLIDFVGDPVTVTTTSSGVQVAISGTGGGGGSISSGSVIHGAMEYVDSIDVSVDTSSVVFGAGGDGILGTALDGNVDKEYILVHHIVSNGVDVHIHFRPNGATTNQTGSRRSISSTATGEQYNAMVIADFGNYSVGEFEAGTINFQAETGLNRTLTCLNSCTGGGNQFARVYAGTWAETSTNVTSIEIAVSTGADEIPAGSRFTLYRRSRASSVLARSRVSYVRAGLTAAQTGIAIGDAVAFDDSLASAGSEVSLDTATNVGRFTVSGDGLKSFVLSASVFLEHSSAFLQDYAWWDVTNGAEVPGSRIRVRSTTASAHWAAQHLSQVLVQPPGSTEYEFRRVTTTGETNGPDVAADATFAEVFEINPSSSDADAIHDNVSGEIAAITEKTEPVASDLMLIEDSADSNNKKKLTLGNLRILTTGAFEYVDTIEVDANTTSVSFGAGGNGLLNRALNGDVDEDYILVYYLPNSSGSTVTYDIQPNGISTNQVTARAWAGSSAGDTTYSQWRIADIVNGRQAYGETVFRAKTGVPRMSNGKLNLQQNSPTSANSWTEDFSSIWNDTSTNITSLDIVASVTDGIQTGAVFTLFRRRSISIDVPKSEVARTSISADTTTLSITGLDGDADGFYEIEGDLLIDGAAIEITMEPNGSTTDLFTSFRLNNASPTRVAGEWLVLDQNSSVGGQHRIRFRMLLEASRTKNGVSVHRAYTLRGNEYYDAGGTDHGNDFRAGGTLENSTSNLTTLDFVSNVADGILAGSEIVVRKRVNMTAVRQADYLIAGLSANQTTNIDVGDHAEFDTMNKRGDSLSLSTGSGQANGIFSLEGGRVYEVHTCLDITVNEGHTYINWYDEGTGSQLSDITGLTTAALFFADDASHDKTEMPSQVFVVAPPAGSTLQIKLEITEEVNLTQIGQGSRIFIKELL